MRELVIVDDDQIIRKHIVRSVNWARLGFNRPHEATNGREGLEMILKIRPDLVLTDIVMPHIDGVQLIRLVRERLPDVPFVVMSNHDDFVYVRGALVHGAVDYLLKHDFSEETLLRVLIPMNITPREQDEEPTGEQGRAEILRAIGYIKDNYNHPLTLVEVSEHVSISRAHFCKLFKQMTGRTFVEYLNDLRIEHAKQYLSRTTLRVSEISEALGYQHSDYFKRVFLRQVGVSPSDYRGQG